MSVSIRLLLWCTSLMASALQIGTNTHCTVKLHEQYARLCKHRCYSTTLFCHAVVITIPEVTCIAADTVPFLVWEGMNRYYRMGRGLHGDPLDSEVRVRTFCQHDFVVHSWVKCRIDNCTRISPLQYLALRHVRATKIHNKP